VNKPSVITTICVTIFLAGSAVCQHDHTAHQQSNASAVADGETKGTPLTVTGFVRDIGCLMRNKKAGAAVTPETIACVRDCIAAGSPIAILTEEGELYTPISEGIPDKSVRDRMLPYAGKYVRVTGHVFERPGLHAIAIDDIKVIDRPANSKIPAY